MKQITEEIIDYLTAEGYTLGKQKYWQKGQFEVFINHKTVTCWKSAGTFFVLPLQANTVQMMKFIFQNVAINEKCFIFAKIT
jgi:hypothetical protein